MTQKIMCAMNEVSYQLVAQTLLNHEVMRLTECHQKRMPNEHADLSLIVVEHDGLMVNSFTLSGIIQSNPGVPIVGFVNSYGADALKFKEIMGAHGHEFIEDYVTDVGIMDIAYRYLGSAPEPISQPENR